MSLHSFKPRTRFRTRRKAFGGDILILQVEIVEPRTIETTDGAEIVEVRFWRDATPADVADPFEIPADMVDRFVKVDRDLFVYPIGDMFAVIDEIGADHDVGVPGSFVADFETREAAVEFRARLVLEEALGRRPPTPCAVSGKPQVRT